MRIPRLPLSFVEILHLIEVLAVHGAATFAGFQLRALRLQNSADLTLRLNQEFETGARPDILNALDSDPSTPIIKRSMKNSGAFTVAQLGDYLGQYETLDDLYRNGLITCRMLYNEFSYDLEKAYKNRDVITEVAEERKDDPSIWTGFLDLGKQFDNGYHCE